MRLDRLRLKNFRCFGPDGTEIVLEPGITTLVGANGSGKTAVFQALARLFGIGRAQRTVVRRDFHVPAGAQQLATLLEIEAQFVFPELDQENADPDGVPEFYRQFIVEAENGPPFCRIRLRASWIDDGTSEGTVEEDVRWVVVAEGSPEEKWEEFPRVSLAERAAVQLIYVPAARDVLRGVSSVLKGRLWQAAKWSNEFAETVRKTSEKLQERFIAEGPVDTITKVLKQRWQQLHRGDTDRSPVFRLVESELDKLVRRAEVVFRPDEAGGERPVDELSDGQRALFHIALTAAVLEVERTAHSSDIEQFDPERLPRPHLTLLAIEEPENHLAPFFLARIIEQARDIAGNEDAQVLLSSHSASILGRIEPAEVRYFRLDETTRTTSVRELALPDGQQEVGRYVRLAVRAYPELYFARFVILVEGDSERIVIPRVAEAMGIPLDPSFVPVVPLGGRHVEHFWHLLEDLGIPYATLLDLDWGRAHGGHKTALRVAKLLKSFDKHVPDDLFELSKDDSAMGTNIKSVLDHFEKYHVFFSCPLDLDFAMLRTFPNAYHESVQGGHGPKLNTPIDKVKYMVLGSDSKQDLYQTCFDESFVWYRYLFLQRSKPDIHLSALSRLSNEDLATRSPPVLRRLVRHVSERIGLGAPFPNDTNSA